MRRSIAFKFLAFLLCAFSLVMVVFSGIGIACMELNDLYETPLETVRQSRLSEIGWELAEYYAGWQAAETLSNAPTSLLNNIYYSSYANRSGSQYAVLVYENGEPVRSVNDAASLKGTVYTFQYTLTPSYPIVTGEIYRDPQYDETSPVMESMLDAASATGADAGAENYKDALARVAGQEILHSEQIYDHFTDEDGFGRQQIYSVNYYAGPTYEVTVHLSDQSVLDAEFMLLCALYPNRDLYVPALLGSLLIFLATLVFLCCAAGHSRSGDVQLAAFNRVPLDLYLLCALGCTVLLTLPVNWLWEMARFQSSYNIWNKPRLCLLICGLCSFGIAALFVGLIYIFAAQSKAGDRYLLRHTLAGRCFTLAGKVLRRIGQGFAALFRGCRAVLRMLPLIWQWLLSAFCMVLAVALFFFLAVATHGLARVFSLLLCLLSLGACIAVICYGGWCFGTLLKGARHMAEGDLHYQINVQYLIGCFRDFALQLNALAGAVQTAAQQQMKSERMKTELITNVSHDIKTPLTSIINYVDLMKKPHSDAENDAYLDVLDRQSQRLKKLIDDLMEMSKASSGNISVELAQVDVAEAVNQALGEFSGKLEQVNLTPVFRHPETSVIMQADGRLLWRVLSNLLSNAVKYALPGTRLYIDLMTAQDTAVLAIKNISRVPLNISADRFVRGDASRNTEGSGLGLNIARSLVELQKGQMHLMVDGDLFKVTLVFPLG